MIKEEISRIDRGDVASPVSECNVSKRCGGCSLTGVPYEKQLEDKQKKLKKLLEGFAPLSPILGMQDPYHYRNKVHHVFAYDRKKGILSGCYEEKTHRVVDITDCLIEDEKCQEIIRTVRQLCRSFKIRTYDEDTGFGSLRHVLVRRGFQSGEIMVVLVLGDPILPGKNNFVKALLSAHPEITTIVLNINDKKTSMVLGEREKALYGPGFIRDRLCGLNFRISPKSFYQINPVQTEVLYDTALRYAGLTGKESVIDAYCGIGTIGLCAARSAGRVLGIELNPDAVKDALKNAKENRITNARFITGDAGKVLVRMAEEGQRCDCVFMDPPRTGSSEQFMEACVKLSPGRIVYISCGPDTLARDLNYLTRRGYQTEKIQPVDMFPFTEHVETVCLLSKLSGAKHHVEVELNADDMEAASAEKKATYDKIREYVKTKTGLQVTNLYIAQVKRECGIIERENYNIRKATRRMDCLQSDSTTATNLENVNSQGQAKSEDSKQPQCPDEKKKAIKEALIHFGMI